MEGHPPPHASHAGRGSREGGRPGTSPRPPLRVWVWTAAALALALVAVLLWRGSSVAATDSTTSPAPRLPATGPAAQLSEVWSLDAGPTGLQRVVQSGRVVVPGGRGITAVDALTGEEAWHYRRADARLCGSAAVGGLVVAVFRTDDRCDEAVALDAGTGVRQWTRNLSLRGDATVDASEQAVLASSPTGVVVVDPGASTVRWRVAAGEGCVLAGTDVGSAGVALLERCPGATALQLRLYDPLSGQQRWTRDVPDAVPGGAGVRLVGADRLVAVTAGDALVVHSPDDGTPLQELPLPPAGTGTDTGTDTDPGTEPLLMAGVGDVALVWARGELWALDPGSGTARWQLPARGLPADDVGTAGSDPAAVWVPESDGFVLRDLATGAEAGRAAVDGGPGAGGRTSAVGPVLVHRLPDRVLGYA
jgi:outer membrane protein assembly factor BamB